MMRSLFAGVAGLKNHQTRMDVIGNNIANVNTVGFKSSRVNFQDILSQTLQGASAAQGNRGGTNPKQVGLGMGVASIDTIFTDGSYQTTGKQTDLSVQGQGFFIVSDGANQYYTRAGNFDFDVEGNYLVPGTGLKVVGWMADANGVINTSGTTGNIKVPVGSTMPAKATTSFDFINNLSADAKIGTIATSSVDVYDSLGNAHTVSQTYVKVNDNTWITTSKVTDGTITGGAVNEISFDSEGKVQSPLALSPLAITTTPTTVTTGVTIKDLQLGDVSTTLPYTIYDTNGALHTVNITFTNTTPYATGVTDGKWTYSIDDGGGMTSVTGEITYPKDGSSYIGFPSSLPYTGGQVGITVANSLPPVGGSSTNTATNTDKSYPTKQADIKNLQLDNAKNSVHSENYTVFDSAGVPHVFQMEITTKQDYVAPQDGKWSYKITELGQTSTTPISSGEIVYDGTNYSGFPAIPYDDGGVSSLLKFNLTTPQAPQTGTFIASSDSYKTTGTAVPLTLTPTGKAANMSLSMNYDSLTQYGGDSTLRATNGDGYAAGTLDLAKLTIDQSGVIVGGFTNGRTQNLGQVALAVFNNPGGLNKAGESLFAKSNNSGEAQIGTGGSGGRGTFTAGTLEMSNVDLAQQFSDMIITQRGFQANSKIITTTDEMLEQLANLKR